MIRDKRKFYHRKAEQAEEAAGKGNQRELFKISKKFGQMKIGRSSMKIRINAGRSTSKVYSIAPNLKLSNHC